MSYFIKQEDPTTKEVTYVEVPDDQLEVPTELIDKAVVAHPKYREVVDESIKRKKTIKQLREQLDHLEEPEAEGQSPASPEQDATVQKPVSQAAPLDEDALYSKFTARLRKEQEDARAAEAAKANNLKAIAEKHGLGAGALKALEVAADPEALASILEGSQYRFDDTVGGAPSQPDKDALQNKIFANLGLDD